MERKETLWAETSCSKFLQHGLEIRTSPDEPRRDNEKTKSRMPNKLNQREGGSVAKCSKSLLRIEN